MTFHLLNCEEAQCHGWRILPCWADVQSLGVAPAITGVMLRVDTAALQEHGLYQQCFGKIPRLQWDPCLDYPPPAFLLPAPQTVAGTQHMHHPTY